MKQINVNVVGDPKGDVPVLIGDDGTRQNGTITGNRAVFVLLDTASGGALIAYSGNRSLRVIIPPRPGAFEADLAPVRPPEATGPIQLTYTARTPRLHAADDSLVDETGTRVVLGLTTDFCAFKMYLDGQEDLSDILDERKAAGSQGVRVFGTCVNLFGLDPRDYRDYYESLTAFAGFLEERGEYLHFTAIADAQLLRPGFDAAAHWQHCCDVLADAPNVVLCELVNEYFKNGVDPRQFSKPAKAPLVSAGSFVDGDYPPAPWGDVATFHPTRNWKWWFTVAATAQEIRKDPRGAGKPIWIGEPMGAAEADRNDRSCVPDRFDKLGASIGIYSAGGCFHSDAGLKSERWGPRQTACARAFFRGIHR